MKSFKEFAEENISEGKIEDTKERQVEYAKIAKEIEKSSEFKALVAKIRKEAEAFKPGTVEKHDWAMVGIIGKLEWLD